MAPWLQIALVEAAPHVINIACKAAKISAPPPCSNDITKNVAKAVLGAAIPKVQGAYCRVRRVWKGG